MSSHVGRLPSVSDLAFVVISPEDRFSDVMRRMVRFADAGARRIVLIPPNQADVIVYTVADNGRISGHEIEIPAVWTHQLLGLGRVGEVADGAD